MDHIKKCCRCGEVKYVDDYRWDSTREVYVAACKICLRSREQELRDSKKKLYNKKCQDCKRPFKAKRIDDMFCKKSCGKRYRKNHSWAGYLQGFLYKNRKDQGLTLNILLKTYEAQNGLCALTGVEMTRITGQGSVTTNASVDRIEAGGPYVGSNIQLVCFAVNSFRSDKSIAEYVWWCKKVVDYNV